MNVQLPANASQRMVWYIQMLDDYHIGFRRQAMLQAIAYFPPKELEFAYSLALMYQPAMNKDEWPLVEAMGKKVMFNRSAYGSAYGIASSAAINENLQPVFGPLGCVGPPSGNLGAFNKASFQHGMYPRGSFGQSMGYALGQENQGGDKSWFFDENSPAAGSGWLENGNGGGGGGGGGNWMNNGGGGNWMENAGGGGGASAPGGSGWQNPALWANALSTLVNTGVNTAQKINCMNNPYQPGCMAPGAMPAGYTPSGYVPQGGIPTPHVPYEMPDPGTGGGAPQPVQYPYRPPVQPTYRPPAAPPPKQDEGGGAALLVGLALLGGFALANR